MNFRADRRGLGRYGTSFTTFAPKTPQIAFSADVAFGIW
jgi:hypothetical protein